MRFPGFVGPSYNLQTRSINCQRTINLFPEMDPTGTAKAAEVAALLPTPGLRFLATIGLGPIRATWTSDNGRYFVVSKNKVYEVSSLWAATELGTLTTNEGPVSMVDNGVRLAIVDGSTSGFFFNFTTSLFSPIPFPEDINFVTFAGCDKVVYIDGYFLFNHKGYDHFFISGKLGSIVADDSTIDAADFSTGEANPDVIVSIMSADQNLWVFGRRTIEIYYNSGNADFPFERTQGAFIPVGLAAAFSCLQVDTSVIWLGRNEFGHGIVYRAQGYQAQKISTHAIDRAIQSYGDISAAKAFTYQQDGHFFYVLNFTAAQATWVYDLTTGLWHERLYTNQGQFERHRADCHAVAFSKHVVGDYENGNLYELTSDVYTDNGVEITRQRISPHVSSNQKWVTYHSLELDIEKGVGLDGVGQGTDPQIMMQFSDDGGYTWSNEKWTSMGKIGERRTRPIWRRLGMSRDRVFKVTITDPVKVVILGAEIEPEAAAS